MIYLNPVPLFLLPLQVFFMKKFGMEAKSANFITGLIYLISAPASPLLGLLIDKTGRNVFYVFLSIVATLAGHMTLAFTFVNPYVAVIGMGVAYSLLASALWPIAALVIPEYQLGTAYGEDDRHRMARFYTFKDITDQMGTAFFTKNCDF